METEATPGKPSSGRKLSVNIVVRYNGGGLTVDADILAGIFSEYGCRVWFNGRRVKKPKSLSSRIFHGLEFRFRHRWAAISSKRLYDVNLFVEHIEAGFLAAGRLNCLIPNPEWFVQEYMPHLPAMDMVLCKTRDAVGIFQPLARNVRYIGFTSRDKFEPEAPRDGGLKFLHAAGASRSKGTTAVLAAWRRHPEWPLLVVIRSPTWYNGEAVHEETSAPNIKCVTDRLNDEALRRFQNTCEVHLCPSEAEGFGHIIVEAMSCAALVITTDGPPMNEIVTAERGVLVSHERTEPMQLGTSFFVSVDDLERQIGRVLKMDPNERRALGANARNWHQAQGMAFRKAMRNLIEQVWPEQIARKCGERT